MRYPAITVACMLLATAAQAQSFNCGYARSPTEVAICQSPDLSMMDQAMAASYFRLENQLPYQEAARLQAEQLAWLADRNACGYDFVCLGASYNQRIIQLCQWSWYIGNTQPCSMSPME